MENKNIFATRLKELRLKSGKTQKEFAEMASSTAATISAYENATKNPSLEIVMNIAGSCNVSIDWLCGLNETQNLISEFNNYKDIALLILNLLDVGKEPNKFVLNLYPSNNPTKEEYDYDLALKLPEEPELFKFFDTFEALRNLLKAEKIKQHVIDAWMMGALEELANIPIIPKRQE